MLEGVFVLGLVLATFLPARAWPQSDPGYAEQQRLYGQDSQTDSGQGIPQQGYGQPAQPLNSGDLEQLVAPIALYPDALVAQVLAASTYPSQVADADQWRRAQGNATPDQIAAGADVQNWDPSVKALTAFPQVLAQMDRNQQWTTDLGNAYYNQPQDVLEAVQVMRRRAQAAGTLQSTPQEIVREDAGNIELVPANPQFVYVPAYNPWVVYGAPISPYPGFTLLDAIGAIAGGLRYGLGIGMAAFMHTPWGWLAWGLNWLTHALMFNHSNYYSHSATVADWGFPHQGFHAYAGHGGFPRFADNHARLRENETWRHTGYNAGGWHDFARAPDRRPDNWRGADNWQRENRNDRASRGPEFGNGFANGSERLPHENYNRAESYNRPERYSRLEGYRSVDRSTMPRQYARNGAERATAPAFENYGGDRFANSRASHDFARLSPKPARSSGHHLFGGGSREPRSFRGEKNFGGKSFSGRNFGGSFKEKSFKEKSFGGKAPKAPHGSGGGHGGKHHR
jgi:Protein of unknown function (DUF3300)